MSKICVAVRKRPCAAGDKDIVDCAGQNLTLNEPRVKYDLTPFIEKHAFVFDEVLGDKVGNREVYARCAQPLIDTVFSNGNATCFAYGQTGSGKTHTMLGKGSEPGLYACAAHDIFRKASKQNPPLVVFASFYEIYGRKLFDLLNNHAKLFAREDAEKVINICGLTEYPVSDVQGLFDLIAKGSEHRAAGQTSANSESSRSHAVLQLEVREQTGKGIGRMSFIDLAGNERGSDTFDCDRRTRMEGAEINKSLLALKECIRALGMGKSHVPFRGSVLTEVLRDSFLGNSRTTMIATISGSSANCEHSLNTLRYTQRVKELGPAGRREGRPNGSPSTEPEARGPALAPPAPKPKKKARPEWIDDFAVMDADSDAGPTTPSAQAPAPAQPQPPPLPPAPVKPKGREREADKEKEKREHPGSGRPAGGVPAKPNRPAPAKPVAADIPDEMVASIVKQRLQEFDADEAELAQAESDEDDSAPAPSQHRPSLQHLQPNPAAMGKRGIGKVKAVHAHLVKTIRTGEEELMAHHRRHVDHKMQSIREEVDAIQALDDGTIGIDDYVGRIETLLAKQQREVQQMKERLGKLQVVLREEELLSRTLTPAAGNRRAAK